MVLSLTSCGTLGRNLAAELSIKLECPQFSQRGATSRITLSHERRKLHLNLKHYTNVKNVSLQSTGSPTWLHGAPHSDDGGPPPMPSDPGVESQVCAGRARK